MLKENRHFIEMRCFPESGKRSHKRRERREEEEEEEERASAIVLFLILEHC